MKTSHRHLTITNPTNEAIHEAALVPRHILESRSVGIIGGMVADQTSAEKVRKVPMPLASKNCRFRT